MEKMNSDEIKEYEKIKSSYDDFKEFLINSGYYKHRIYNELLSMYPNHTGFLENDEYFHDFNQANDSMHIRRLSMKLPKKISKSPGKQLFTKQKRIESEDETDYKRSRTEMPISQCVNTENSICMTGSFARYNERRNYHYLDEKFEETYMLILNMINESSTPRSPQLKLVPKTPPESPPTKSITSPPLPRTPSRSPPRLSPDSISLAPNPLPDILQLGLFLIVVERETIRFAKTEWNDVRDKGARVITKVMFEELMKNITFKKYMQTYITKIVQDRFVSDRTINPTDRQNFYVLLDFYFNRRNKYFDLFHQDRGHFIDVGYFTLTYVLPQNKVILGPSLLVAPDTILGKDRIEPGKYASLSVAIKNLTTIGITNKNKTFHSTPAPISCRKFKNGEEDCFIPSYIDQHRTGLLETIDQNPDTFEHREMVTNVIDLAPLDLPPLPYSEMESVSKVIDDTIITRRTFLRCWYAETKDMPVDYSNWYSYSINLNELYEETLTIEDITLDTFFQHVVGGKGKKTRKVKMKINITQLRKILYDPNRNLIIT